MLSKYGIYLTLCLLYCDDGFKKYIMKRKRKNIFIQYIVHISHFSHDMKVRHRHVLYSGRRQIERHLCAALRYLICHFVPGRR